MQYSFIFFHRIVFMMDNYIYLSPIVHDFIKFCCVVLKLFFTSYIFMVITKFNMPVLLLMITSSGFLLVLQKQTSLVMHQTRSIFLATFSILFHFFFHLKPFVFILFLKTILKFLKLSDSYCIPVS